MIYHKPLHSAAVDSERSLFDDELDVNDDIMNELDSCDPDEDAATISPYEELPNEEEQFVNDDILYELYSCYPD